MKNYIVLLFLLLGYHAGAQSYEEQLKQITDSFYKAFPKTVGIMIHVECPAKKVSFSYANGLSDKQQKTPLQPDQPVLLASNTKTYVAAAILRLAEQHLLTIEDPINTYLTNTTDSLMKQAGYAHNSIRIKHLLSHTSGIADYVDDAYFNFVNTHRQYFWTREEQIRLAMKDRKPIAAPGDSFRYADINYVLATEIIEHVTGQPYDEAIFSLLQLREHNLNTTWFVLRQKPIRNTPQLAHQYWSKYPWDAYELNPSWDLYGGGGLAANTRDLARFFYLLFEGKIIRDTAVLSQLYRTVFPQGNYRLGIRELNINGHTGYYHGGFWGTDAIYFPDLHTAVSVFILERSEKQYSADICKRIVSVLSTQ